ncbi:MAG: polyprenol monophosphomannose synthase [Anaerolineales bacterium]|nr:polyprenol monophosphomannose synthase [Anaerolineales bacterium]
MEIIVVLPTFNEADNLADMAEALWALPLPGLRVLVVDDASPDGTGAVADRLAGAYPDRLGVIHRTGKGGLGTAYVAGFRRALAEGADVVVQMDCDFSHSPSYLPPFIEKLAEYDVVVGSRYVADGKLDERWEKGRVALSLWANRYARAILGIRAEDATAGFKVWRRATLEGIGLDRIHSNGYVFQVEMAYVAQRLGYRVLEQPIYFEDRRIGRSKMTIPVKLEAAWRVWEVAVRHGRLTPAQRRAAQPVTA